MSTEDLIKEIEKLKSEKGAFILAHNYQIPEVQEIADFVGDSLKMAQVGKDCDNDIIVVAGVKFMAESAKILSPEKRVFLANSDAGCPMADMIDTDSLREFKEKHENIPVVTYVNSSAAVKAESDICCTSANALSIVNSIESDKIIFTPDRCLGHYIGTLLPEKEIILYDGFCITHNRLEVSDIEKAREEYPGVKLLVHPECDPEIVEKADFVGSTSAIIAYCKNSDDDKFIIGTEEGILHQLKKDSPEKEFILLSDTLVCENMKKTSLEDMRDVLRDEKNEIFIDEKVRKAAFDSLDKMLKI